MTTIYESEHPFPPLPKLSIFQYLFPDKPNLSPLQPAILEPSRVAFIDGINGRQVTRGEVEDQALRLSRGISSLGLSRGDVACIFGLNSLEWINAAFGCGATGIVVSPINYAYCASEVAYQVNDSGASVIFLDLALVPVFDEARTLISRPFPNSRVILLCSSDLKPTDSPYAVISDLWESRGVAERFENGSENEVAWLCYSSGTTGLPKGVMTTHHNMTSQIQACNVVYHPPDADKDIVIGILPFSHMYGLTFLVHQPLAAGTPVVVLPRFEEKSVLRAIEKYKVTHATFVPPVLIVLIHSKIVKDFDISSLKSILIGAAPASADLCTAYEDLFPGCIVYQGYGMTETTPAIAICKPNESMERKCSVGRLIPTFQARLVDENDEDVAPGIRGELWLRSPSVMKGYHRNEIATAKTFAPGGWLRTGDVAVRDPDGYFIIVDRLKELIKVNGLQVAPAELEALLLTHPKVFDVGVIGVYDKDRATEFPRAYIVGAPEYTKTPADCEALGVEVSSWVEKRVARHKRLGGGVIVVDVIPKTPSGKILRKTLRAFATQENFQPKAKL